MNNHVWAIVIFPQFAPEQRQAIDRIRAAYDPLAAAIAPHITLVFPFESALTGDELLAHMRSAVAPAAQFGIDLRGVTGSQDEWLFLNVKRGNDQLIALHDQLYSGPLARYREPRFTYTPHLTVGRLASGAAFTAALGEMATTLTGTFQSVARVITAYRIAGNGERAEKYSLPLPP